MFTESAPAAPDPDPSGRAGGGSWVPLGLITALGLALRLADLGHESAWLDECYSLSMAGRSLEDLISARAVDPGNPQGYYLLLHAWMRMLRSDTVETARAFSAWAGALAIPAVVFLARRGGVSRRAGLLAALLVAINPSLVYLSREARTYALLCTLTTFAAGFIMSLRRGTSGPSGWVMFAAIGAGLVHLHYDGPLVLAALGLSLLWGGRRIPGTFLRLCLLAATVAAAFSPWLPIFLAHVGSRTTPGQPGWWFHFLLLPLYTAVGRTLVWKSQGTAALALMGAAITGLLFVPIAGILGRRRCQHGGGADMVAPASAFVVGLGVLVALAGFWGVPVRVHYLSVLTPTILLLCAYGIDQALRWRAWWLLAGPAAVLGLLGPLSLTMLYQGQHKPDWRGVAGFVEEAAPDLPVYFYNNSDGLSFAYYRPGQTRHPFWRRPDRRGEPWRTARVWGRLQAEPGGFWLVAEEVGSDVPSEPERLVNELQPHFRVGTEGRFGPIRVWLVRPDAP